MPLLGFVKPPAKPVVMIVPKKRRDVQGAMAGWQGVGKACKPETSLPAMGAYTDVSGRGMHVSLTQEAGIATDLHFIRAAFAVEGFISANDAAIAAPFRIMGGRH